MIESIGEIENAALKKYLESKTDYTYAMAFSNIEKPISFTVKAKNASAQYFFRDCKNLKSFNGEFDTSAFYMLSNFFANCVELTEVAGFATDNSRYFTNLFNGCVKLEKILKPLNLSVAFSTQIDNVFKNCKSLKTVSFVTKSIKASTSFSDSPLLAAESVQSIIDGLAPVTTATTVTFHKDVALTDSQKQQITDKGWTLVQA